MKYKILFIVLLVKFSLILADDVTVKTPLGEVLGVLHHAPGWRDFYAFQGIRYAEPPTGELRWKPPIPAKPWTETFDARANSPWCHQHDTFFAPFFKAFQTVLTEDCLRVSVSTHNLNPINGKLFPVIVDFHGGAFTAGGGGFTFMKPTYLMNEDVVHVTANYRLGVLGFLSAGTAEVPGNAGLKDQVLALKWVKENIASFGGDPDNVTIMGYSAGGYSVTGHLLSPMSSGLFHRAIPMSGSMLAHFLLPKDHELHIFHKVAHDVNCNQTTIAEITECLRKHPAQDLENVLGTFFKFGFCPILSTGPVIETDFGQERFFVEQPSVTISSGNFNKVPVLTGMAKDEFAVLAHTLLSNETIRSKLNDNFEEVASECFVYKPNTEKSKHITEVLLSNFITLPLEKSAKGITELQKPIGDSIIGHGVHRLVQLINTQVNVFYYKFSYVSGFSSFNYPGDKPWGVDHGDEMQYIFESPFAGAINDSLPSYTTTRRFTKLISNFAATGNPTSTSDEFIGDFQWVPFNKNDQNYLNIGDELEMMSGLYLDRFRVWDELFPAEVVEPIQNDNVDFGSKLY